MIPRTWICESDNLFCTSYLFDFHHLVKKKQAQALVSCGNTGALVCGATLYLGLIKGVDRPGLALIIPTLKGTALLVDVGANIDPKPLHLLM